MWEYNHIKLVQMYDCKNFKGSKYTGPVMGSVAVR